MIKVMVSLNRVSFVVRVSIRVRVDVRVMVGASASKLLGSDQGHDKCRVMVRVRVTGNIMVRVGVVVRS